MKRGFEKLQPIKEYKLNPSSRLLGVISGLFMLTTRFIDMYPDFTPSTLEIGINAILVIMMVVSTIYSFSIKLILYKDGFLNIGPWKTVYMEAKDVKSCVVSEDQIILTSKQGEKVIINTWWENFNKLKEEELIKRLSQQTQQ